jgi:hypothetical protein
MIRISELSWIILYKQLKSSDMKADFKGGVRNGSLSKRNLKFINKFIGRLLHSVSHEDELLTFAKLTQRERERERERHKKC